MRIALVHDYLSQDGGAERVLRVLHELWPEAPIYTLFIDREKFKDNLARAEIRESYISSLPFARKKYQWYMPLMPWATESYDFSDFDVVVSSTSAYAKGIKVGSNTIHICYCHTPTRYLWSDTASYLKELPQPRPVKWLLSPIIAWQRIWDLRAARDRVDYFIANSQTVAQRIRRWYGRTSTVIEPPIDNCNNRTPAAHTDRTYFLAGGRLVGYKRIDLVIEVFNRLGLPLKIFGTGRELEQLRRLATSPSIEFIGQVSEEDKWQLYAHARAFINPQAEDFGITMTEALAQGCPVIAYRKDGATEIVKEGVNGVLFPEQTWESLLDAVLHFDAQTLESPAAIARTAAPFSKERFKERIRTFVNQAVSAHKATPYADSHRRTTAA